MEGCRSVKAGNDGVLACWYSAGLQEGWRSVCRHVNTVKDCERRSVHECWYNDGLQKEGGVCAGMLMQWQTAIKKEECVQECWYRIAKEGEVCRIVYTVKDCNKEGGVCAGMLIQDCEERRSVCRIVNTVKDCNKEGGVCAGMLIQDCEGRRSVQAC